MAQDITRKQISTIVASKAHNIFLKDKEKC
jgi:hypothetical protein